MEKKTLIKIGAVLLSLGVLTAAGIFIAVRSIDTDQLKEMLTTQVKKSTGRVLTINGPVDIQLGLVPRVVVNDVSLSNPPGATRPEMAKIKRFEMEVAIRPLLSKQVMVNRLLVSSPDVLIETEPKGPGNLDFTAADKQSEQVAEPTTGADEKSAVSSGFSFVVNELKIDNGTFTHYDRASKKSERIILELLSLRRDKKNPQLLNMHLLTTIRGQKIDLGGNLGNIDTVLSGKPWPVQLKAVLAGVKVQAEGSVADIKAFQGLNIKLAAQGNELAEVIALAGEQAPKIPGSIGPFAVVATLNDKGKQFSLENVDIKLGRKELVALQATGSIHNLGGTPTPDLKIGVESVDPVALSPFVGADIPVKGPFYLSGLVKGSGSQWAISDMQMSANTSDLKGSLQVQLGKRPSVSGQLASESIDRADFTAAPQTGAKTEEVRSGKGKGDGRLFSDQPLALTALNSADADLKLQVGKLLLDARQLTNVEVTLALKNGKLAVAPFRFGLAGGSFDGKVHLDGSVKTPTLTVAINGKGFELGKLQEKSPLSGGKSELKVDLKGRGQSVRALMATLTGETVLSVGEGRLANKAINWAAGDFLFQILGSINPFAKNEEYTKMSCAAVRFILRDGVATADDGLAMRTDKVDVVGSGTVNLGNERLDLGIKPRARSGIGLSLSTPLAGLVRVNGTLAKPAMGIDAVGTLKTAASVGAGVATGGLSTLGELLVDKVVADSDPCQTALGKTKSGNKGADTKSQPQKKTTPERQLLQGLWGK